MAVKKGVLVISFIILLSLGVFAFNSYDVENIFDGPESYLFESTEEYCRLTLPFGSGYGDDDCDDNDCEGDESDDDGTEKDDDDCDDNECGGNSCRCKTPCNKFQDLRNLADSIKKIEHKILLVPFSIKSIDSESSLVTVYNDHFVVNDFILTLGFFSWKSTESGTLSDYKDIFNRNRITHGCFDCRCATDIEVITDCNFYFNRTIWHFWYWFKHNDGPDNKLKRAVYSLIKPIFFSFLEKGVISKQVDIYTSSGYFSLNLDLDISDFVYYAFSTTPYSVPGGLFEGTAKIGGKIKTAYISIRDMGPVIRDHDGDGYEKGEDCNDGYAGIWKELHGYLDRDGDGHGAGKKIAVCSGYNLPAGYSNYADDCNDNDPNINPGKDEICNYIDDNCNYQIDENDVCSHDDEDENDGESYDEGETEDDSKRSFQQSPSSSSSSGGSPSSSSSSGSTGGGGGGGSSPSTRTHTRSIRSKIISGTIRPSDITSTSDLQTAAEAGSNNNDNLLSSSMSSIKEKPMEFTFENKLNFALLFSILVVGFYFVKDFIYLENIPERVKNKLFK